MTEMMMFRQVVGVAYGRLKLEIGAWPLPCKNTKIKFVFIHMALCIELHLLQYRLGFWLCGGR